MNGTAVEIGVREGHFSRHFLEHWSGAAYHGIDPLRLDADLENYKNSAPDVYNFGLETIAILDAEPRFTFHHGIDEAFVNSFPDGSVDFVYIDSLHNYEAVQDTFRRWYPKLRRGGIISGHDFCGAADARKEEAPKLWPRPDLPDHLKSLRLRVPNCGVYRCVEGEFCYPKDKARLGRAKIGFAGVAYAAIEAAEREATHLQWTQEMDPQTHEGITGNPSWWAIKN
mmetsp:Transcript_13143/g.46577  ORF Transcript_13143/g.46577 Transcript_13143/m.46577 type:complete len:226 (+) Transcript_13143:129-806(+)